MGKGKLAKFADLETFGNVFQCPYSALEQGVLDMRGRWHEAYFKNQHPIVLELGCGKGEYTVELARRYPEKNFIGIDIKGARLWTGASLALRDGLTNVAFLRTNIEIIDRFFAEGEVDELWLTFCDPQMKNPRKRLTSTYFLQRYRHFLVDGGCIHLKTDSNFLFTYTSLLVEKNRLPVELRTEDLYSENSEKSENSENSEYSEYSENSENSENSEYSEYSENSENSENSEYSENSENSEKSEYSEATAIQTYYESMWLARGLNIRYMKYRLPHEGTLEEPDVEIELDDYRSYHRTKRSSLDARK